MLSRTIFAAGGYKRPALAIKSKYIPALFKGPRRRFSKQKWTFLRPQLPYCRPTRHERFAHVQASAPVEAPDELHLPSQGVERRAVLLPPSKEQQVAIDTLLHSNNNLIVDACAGSGKTTTILHLAQSAPHTRFLVLVYNTRLMVETEERVQALGLQNVTVLNYHTLGFHYYTPECATDQGLKRVVEDDMSVVGGMRLPDFSVLVMDEQQDMTPILKRFVDKLIRDKGFAGKARLSRGGNHELRVVVLGDRRQEVYGFNNADSRFLTLAARPEVFGYVNEHGWTSAQQTTSNRVTQQNVDFINQQMLKRPLGEAMRAVRNRREDGVAFPKPRYVICDPYEDLLDEVLRLLDMGDLSPTDIIVLAPSVRGSSPAIYLANALALRGIPVFRSDSDVPDINPSVARGKVLICSYHQAKGIERKASIVLGFDQNYHTWYDKVVAPPEATSNPQYVAATRALEHMVLVHDCRSQPLPFVNIDTIEKSCDLVTVRPLQPEKTRSKQSVPLFGVTALCRNLSETLITACLRRLEVRMLAAPAYGVSPSPPTEVPDRYGLLENVSSVTGTAVPAVFQWRQRRKLAIVDGPMKLLEPPKRQAKRPNPLRDLPGAFYEKLEDIRSSYDDGNLGTDGILFLSTLEMAAKDKDITKLLALPLDGYNWLSEAQCKDIHYTLNSLQGPAKAQGRGIFFEDVKHKKFPTITHGGGPTNPDKKEGIILSGAMDICRPGKINKTVWEIKYTQSLQPEHLLQVALYMLLLGESASGFLVSARTGQTVQVLPRTPQSLMEILQLLVDAKSGGEQTRLLNTYSDEEFLRECGRDFEGLVDKCALPAWFAMRPAGSKFSKADGSPTRRRRKAKE